MNWRKCPSVRPVGKPYFWVTFTEAGKRTVVWDRIEDSWIVQSDQEPPHGHVRTLGLFNTPKQAMQFIEKGERCKHC